MKRFVSAVLMFFFTLTTTAIAAEFSATMSTEMMGMKMPGKIYFKDQKTSRTEMSTGMMDIVVITKNPKSYQLFPSTKKYVVVDMEEMKKQNPMADVENFDEWLQKNNFKKSGTESIQGFECIVYEGVVDTQSTEEGVPASIPAKLWYSKKLEYPIKTEMEVSGMKMSTAIENISLGSQPVSLFELPSGYTEAKDTQEAMGLGSMGLPSGSASGQAPTQSQIDEAMKQVQEMMKGAQAD